MQKKVVEQAKQQSSQDGKLDKENASLRDELSATRTLMRQQSEATLEAESLRGQLAEARRNSIEGGQNKLEIERLQACIATFEARIAEQDVRSTQLQQKCAGLEGAERNAQEEVTGMRSKMTTLAAELNSALANASKALQQRSEARECAAMAKAENDIVRIERAVETQKLRGAIEELRFAIKTQVASGICNQPFQPQPRVRAF